MAETLIGLLRADPTSYLNVYPRFEPFLGTDLGLGPRPNPDITGNRSYTRAHFLYYAGVLTPGTYQSATGPGIRQPMVTQKLSPSFPCNAQAERFLRQPEMYL